MRVLVFGGGFDPPHRGHEAMLRAAARDLKADLTLLVPAWRSPTKEDHGASPADRLAMTRLMASTPTLPSPLGGGSVDRFEFRRRRRTFTYELFRHVRDKYPDAELWFLLGSDSADALNSWRRPNELRRLARWIVARRPGARARLPEGFEGRFLPGVFPDISSREVRARLYAGEPWRQLVPRAVADYIERRGLYGLSARRELEATLKPERYEHSLSVARLAASLARRHGLDPSAAAQAGLLHDCGRRFDPAEMARYARRHRLPVPAREATLRESPLLAHAYISADLARRRFGVRDEGVLSAIAQHTLGRPGMGRFERLLYVADLASEDRGFPAASRVRALAGRDLDAAFREAVRVKMLHVRSNGLWMHPVGPRLERWSRSL